MRVVYFTNTRRETATLVNNESDIGKPKLFVTQVFIVDNGDEFEIRGDREDLIELFQDTINLLELTKGPGGFIKHP